MTAFTPQLGLIIVSAVAVLMIRLGLDRGLLEQRRARRRCGSCGRFIEGRVCRTCTKKPR